MAAGTVPGLLTFRAALEPDRVALLLEDGRALTYAEWDQRSDVVAHQLRKRNLAMGDRVGLVFPPSGWLDFAVTYCGVQKAGGVAVPLNANLSPATVQEALTHCAVAGTILGTGVTLPGTPGWQAQMAGMAGMLASVGGDKSGGVAESGGDERVAVPVGPADCAQILYTSGTTGRPKGVAASHANLTHGLDPSGRRALAHSTHCLHAFSLGTNAAQSMLIKALVVAPTTVIASTFDAERFAALIERHRVGSVFLVPSMAVELVNARVHERHDLSSLLLLGSTAAALPPAVAVALTELLPGTTLINCYTSTEAAPAELTMVFDPDRPGAVGRPERDGQLRITDPDGRVLPTGLAGAVWLRSGAPAREYLNDPLRSAEAFAGDWIAMGDLGHLDAEGYLHLLDRADDMVKSGGLAVSTLRVEAALYEHPGVAGAAVIGIAHPVLGQVPAAAVVVTPGAEAGVGTRAGAGVGTRAGVGTGAEAGRRGSVSEVELRAFLAARLDRHELPALVRFVPSLPLNAAGKVSKTQLRELLGLGTRRTGAAPDAGTAEVLAGLWSRLLGGEEMGIGDDFFARGGDSLRASQLATLVTEAFGVPASVELAFDHPDLLGQAAWIDAADSADNADNADNADAVTAGASQVLGFDAADRSVPLSGLQEELLRWMHETEPPRDVGPMYVSLRVDDELDAGLLAGCLEELVHRHESLRTRFRQSPAGWEGVLVDSLPTELCRSVAAGGTPAERESDAAEMLVAEVSRPFDWQHGPLVRMVVIEVGPQFQLVALVVHHLVVDGWSLGVLLRELGELYSARRAGAEPVLTAATQAAAVTAWTRARWPAQRAWWRAALEGAPGAVESFPGRRPTRQYVAGSEDVALEGLLGARLRLAAVRHRTTPSVVAAAGWLAVLARHTGATEFVVLTPVTGRVRPEFDSAVGCLAQSLLIRVDVGDDPHVAELIARVHAGLRSATDHQAYPMAEFGALVPYPVEIPVSQWPGRTHFPGLVSSEYPLPHGLLWHWPLPENDRGVPKLELAAGSDGRLSGRLTYNRRAFDVTTVRELITDLHEVLAGAIAVPGSETAGSSR